MTRTRNLHFWWKLWSCRSRRDNRNMPRVGDFKQVDKDLEEILDQLIIIVGENEYAKVP